jgi:hypothetical protein
MYSKFLLTIALALFLAPVKVGSNAAKKHLATYSTASKTEEVHQQANHFHLHTLQIIADAPELNASKDHYPLEEDGRSHQFHFNRLNRRKWKAAYLLAAKIILLIAHLCFLASISLHLS